MINSMKMMVRQSSLLSAWLGLRSGKILSEENLTVRASIHRSEDVKEIMLYTVFYKIMIAFCNRTMNDE